MKDKKSAIILCRGKSLEYLKELSENKYDSCMIVNDFKREVNYIYVRKFLEKQKHLIHYVCREYFALLTKKIYEYFNIDFVYLNVLEKEYSGTPPYLRSSPIKEQLDRLGVKSKYLEKNILKYSEPRDPSELRLPGFPTMGVLTTCHVAACMEYTDITVLGLDFYEAEYLTVCSSTLTKDAPKKSGIDKAPRMKNFLSEFLNKFSHINFTFYTYSTFNPDLRHVKIINKPLKEDL